MARGLNNKNPGNIVKTSGVWLGEVIPSRDSRFKEFQTMAYGYRAIFVNLASYIGKGANTIEKIIKKWAPSFENDTASYIRHVSERTGISKDTVITSDNHKALVEITKAISRIENGVPAVEKDVLDGFNLWLKKKS